MLSRSGVILCTLISFCLFRTAASPIISGIEPYRTNQVLVHFDTEARLNYALQYSDNWCFSTQTNVLTLNCTTWSNLFSVPAIPFPNHYVVVDFRTNSHRIYRLRITP